MADAQTATLEFLKAHIDEARSVPLCGNSIGTDRRFLQEYMPELEEFFHYRNVDVSTIKELARRWHPAVLDAMPDKADRAPGPRRHQGVDRRTRALPRHPLPPVRSRRRKRHHVNAPLSIADATAQMTAPGPDLRDRREP